MMSNEIDASGIKPLIEKETLGMSFACLLSTLCVFTSYLLMSRDSSWVSIILLLRNFITIIKVCHLRGSDWIVHGMIELKMDQVHFLLFFGI